MSDYRALASSVVNRNAEQILKSIREIAESTEQERHFDCHACGSRNNVVVKVANAKDTIDAARFLVESGIGKAPIAKDDEADLAELNERDVFNMNKRERVALLKNVEELLARDDEAKRTAKPAANRARTTRPRHQDA